MSGSRPVLLVVAGSDSSGRSGLAVDLPVALEHGCRVRFAVTAVTAQTDERVLAVQATSQENLRAQLAAACSEEKPDAVKVGMLGGRDTVEALADAIEEYGLGKVVVDPVLTASSGGSLLDEEGERVLRECLIPRADLLTPNLEEAFRLTGMEAKVADDMPRVAEACLALGTEAVLLKGGHLEGEQCVDCFLRRDGEPILFSGKRVLGGPFRGTGCRLSSSLAARLARGESLEEATAGATGWLRSRLQEETRETVAEP